MEWLHGFIDGLALTVSLQVFPYLLVGASVGFVVGVIPGLGGHFAMAMAIPFLYNMDTAAGIALLLGVHSTVAQGGGLTAILFSTPGTGQNAATLLDGPPMAKAGNGGIAVGAAMSACFLGAAFGALVLAFLLPLLKMLVLHVGPSEMFMLCLLALSFVAALGYEDLTRSLIAGLMGLFLSMVGLDILTDEPRFTLDLIELYDGVPLVPVILGLFALAEMYSLWSDQHAGAKARRRPQSGKAVHAQILQGIRTTFSKWPLVLRCSAIGSVMGTIPGLGSSAASFVAYGHAKHSSRDKESFGEGNVEGVIGPESANDAVEGGALASTVAFGIPGSSSMAIALSGFYILGLETGPQLLTHEIRFVFLMIFTVIAGNLIGTLLGIFVMNPLIRFSVLPANILVPLVVIVIFAGAYASDSSLINIVITLVFGIVGFFMKVLKYSRASLLIGLVLGETIEKNLYLAIQI
ncbi:MAG: tripartite tricarboxylate transporter permease, partial [Rhodothermales bacterium]|nr:tripartite tricarboxylate transporter permease [Rhodothermales bacterium]